MDTRNVIAPTNDAEPAVSLTLHVVRKRHSSADPESIRDPVASFADARLRIADMLADRYASVTAEVLDSDGEVVSAFDGTAWKHHRAPWLDTPTQIDPCPDCGHRRTEHHFNTPDRAIGECKMCPCGHGAHMNRYQHERLAMQPHADTGITSPQPPPQSSGGPGIWDLVIADMFARDAVGRAKYGTPLRVHNGRDALVDAYQESLDMAVYLRQAIEERPREHVVTACRECPWLRWRSRKLCPDAFCGAADGEEIKVDTESERPRWCPLEKQSILVRATREEKGKNVP